MEAVCKFVLGIDRRQVVLARPVLDIAIYLSYSIMYRPATQQHDCYVSRNEKPAHLGP